MKIKNIERELSKSGHWTKREIEGRIPGTVVNLEYKLGNCTVYVQTSGTDHATCSISVRNEMRPGDARYDDIGDVCFVSKLKQLESAVKTVLLNRTPNDNYRGV